MPAVRDIVTHVEVQVAAKARTCRHNRREHRITMGQKCLAVHDASGGRKNYCVACAAEILIKAKAKLLAMQQDIQS